MAMVRLAKRLLGRLWIMSKSIVFLGHYSGGSKDYDTRHFFFAKELVGLGYKSTIINAAYSHRLATPKKIEEPMVLHEDSGVGFISIKSPKYSGNSLKRVINMFSFVKNLILQTKNIIKIVGKIETIVMASPHPFGFFAAKYLAHKSGAKLIVDIKDIWPLSIIELAGVSRYHPFVVLGKITEILMYRYSDTIISPLQDIQKYFDDSNYRYKTVHIPTGIDTSFYDDIDKNSIFPKDKFKVGYVGGINQANAIDFLLDVAVELEKDYEDIVFVVVGKGAVKKSLMEKYSKYKNILFYDSVLKKEAFSIMRECDVLYKALLPHNVFRYGIFPLKLCEYMYAKVPILHVFDFPQSDLVRKSKGGFCSAYGDKKALRENIVKLYDMSEEKRGEIGQMAKSYVSENLSLKVIVRELKRVL